MSHGLATKSAGCARGGDGESTPFEQSDGGGGLVAAPVNCANASHNHLRATQCLRSMDEGARPRTHEHPAGEGAKGGRKGGVRRMGTAGAGAGTGTRTGRGKQCRAGQCQAVSGWADDKSPRAGLTGTNGWRACRSHQPQ